MARQTQPEQIRLRVILENLGSKRPPGKMHRTIRQTATSNTICSEWSQLKRKLSRNWIKNCPGGWIWNDRTRDWPYLSRPNLDRFKRRNQILQKYWAYCKPDLNWSYSEAASRVFSWAQKYSRKMLSRNIWIKQIRRSVRFKTLEAHFSIIKTTKGVNKISISI